MANAEQTAQGLASLGRYGDSMMVHMNPNEVSGLQQLAEANGSTLTINPDTGMPEAFLGDFINSLLPTAAGIAGGAVGGPAGAAAAGALTGYAQGKRDPLELAMAGLSGYGGGQIGSALGAGGTQALAGTAEAASGAALGTAEAAAAGTFNAPVSNVMGANQMAGVSNFSNIPTAQINQANNLQHLNTGAKVPPGVYTPQGSTDILGESITQVDQFQNYQPSFMDTAPKTPYQIGTDTPQISDFSKGPDMNKFQAPSVPQQYIPQPPRPGILEEGIRAGADAGYDSLKASGSGIKNAFNNPTDFLERLGGGEYTDSAGNIINKGGEGSALYGGIKLGAPIAMAGVDAAYADAYDTVDPITRGGPSGPLNLSDAFRPSMTLPMYAQGGMIPSYQAGGIAGLGYGGLLEGTGDGISDSIPARIDGSQEAALSKGEFVVPARIVSEIGNGSSDAGAERLYAMMDRVEKDRERTTGQGNIAVDTNAERRLPA